MPLTPSTVAWPPSLPSVPTSRATRVTSAANEPSWSTIVLIVSFSSAISPCASTSIFCVRSPVATAVVTWAMLRTWSVRFEARKLTFSVRSFQVPLTPLTSAWPPSLPSVPTSRATRVTSSANEESWSTIVLIVRLSSLISPRAETTIFCDRSPVATAVVTSAMARTWPVRLLAMRLTLSVRSRHVPLTPSTSAWPPSTPSVPTSRATPVTCSANTRRRSVIELIVSASVATSPLASTVTFCERSPLATAVVTTAIWRTWSVRLDAMTFTESVRSFHVPATPDTSAWPPSTPSVPTSRATPVTCSAKTRRVSVIELIVSASVATSPLASTVTFWLRSPCATAVVTAAIWRTWSVRLDAMKFTFSVRSRHVPLTPLTSAWPPSWPSVPTSRATRVTSAANEESWSTIVLIVLLSSRISPRASTVIFCERSPLATAVVTAAIWRTWSVRLEAIELTFSVRSRHVPDTPLTWAWPPSFPSVPTSLRHPGDLVGERAELVDHLVDGVADGGELALHRLALDRQRHLLRQVAARDRLDDARDLGRRADEVVDHPVDGLDGLIPRPVDGAQRHALGHAALAADDPADAGELLGLACVERDQLVAALLDLADDITPAGAQADREVTVAGGGEDAQQLLEGGIVGLAVLRAGAAVRGAPAAPSGLCASCHAADPQLVASSPTGRAYPGRGPSKPTSGGSLRSRR